MAERQVAVIRGINVGRAKRVAMADLRGLFIDLGFEDVGRCLTAGTWSSALRMLCLADRSRIEVEMERRLGLSARVMVLAASDFALIIEENPLLQTADDPSRLLVMVLANPRDRRLLEPLLRAGLVSGGFGSWPTRSLSLVSSRFASRESASGSCRPLVGRCSHHSQLVDDHQNQWLTDGNNARQIRNKVMKRNKGRWLFGRAARCWGNWICVLAESFLHQDFSAANSPADGRHCLHLVIGAVRVGLGG